MRKIFGSKKREPQAAEESSSASSLVNPTPHLNRRLGLKVLHEPSDPSAAVVDIVFLHGLTGDSASTWIHPGSGKYWPATLLSLDIPNSRILSFGYDADVISFWNPVSQNRVGNHALNLLGGLTRLREQTDTEDRKIIFVAHSLGGLVTQDCLWTSRNHPEKHLRQVSSCAMGISFLGTPHHGADLAAWAKFGTIIARIVKHANSDIVSVLRPGSEMLARIQDGFHGLLRVRREEGSEIALTCFFEELPLPVVGKVVEMNSAIIPGYAHYGIHANHMDMTKFNDKDDDGYASVLGELRRWVKGLQANDSPKAVAPLFLVPFSKDAQFVGRVKTFEDIDEKSKSHHRISLSGIGGVGKSQIAIEYCYRFRNLHPTKHIFWVHGSTRQRLEQAYKAIARRLELPGWKDPAVDTLLLVSEWFNDNKEWFMVLDNADDQDTFFEKSTLTVADGERTRPLSDYLPQDSQGLMLITTRDKRMSERLASRHASIIVRPMTGPEAEELLRFQFESHQAWSDDDSRTLLNELEYIPLAITQAAAFISQNSLTLAEYLDMFRADDSEIKDLLNQDLGDPRRDSESLNSIIRTWKLSFDLICKQKLRAAEMLSLMAVLDRQGIPKSLLQRKPDSKVDVATALGTLKAFSLITVEDTGATYQLHRLVQLATQKWLELQGTKEKWQEQALRVLEDNFPEGEFEDWTICESFLPHARTVIQYKDIVERCEEPYSRLLVRIARFDRSQGRYEIARINTSAALEVQQRLFGEDHSNTLGSMNNLASTYRSQGRWDEAEKLQVQVMETSIRVFKEEHPDTLRSMNNLASTYRSQGRWDEAEKLQVQVMETSIRVLGEDHSNTLGSMNNLALTYRSQGRWDEAEKLQVQVMETSIRVFKEEHLDILRSMNNLASTYRSQGRWDEAEKLQVQVMETSIRVLGEDHPDTLSSMNNLASTYSDQGRWDEAEKLQVQVMETSIRVFKEEHPDTLRSMNNLALTYSDQGRWNEAEKLQVQVMETCIRVLGEDHSDTLSSMSNLASTYSDQGRWDEAEKLQVQVMNTRIRVFKEEHPDTLRSINNLASTYLHQGRWDKAEKLQVQVMEARIRVLGEDHPDTLISMNNLSMTYHSQERHSEAIALMEKVVYSHTKKIGANHPDTLISMNNLSMTYHSQERHSEAIALMEKVVYSRTKKIGANHPDTLHSIRALQKWSDTSH